MVCKFLAMSFKKQISVAHSYGSITHKICYEKNSISSKSIGTKILNIQQQNEIKYLFYTHWELSMNKYEIKSIVAKWLEYKLMDELVEKFYCLFFKDFRTRFMEFLILDCWNLKSKLTNREMEISEFWYQSNGLFIEWWISPQQKS